MLEGPISQAPKRNTKPRNEIKPMARFFRVLLGIPLVCAALHEAKVRRMVPTVGWWNALCTMGAKSGTERDPEFWYHQISHRSRTVSLQPQRITGGGWVDWPKETKRPLGG